MLLVLYNKIIEGYVLSRFFKEDVSILKICENIKVDYLGRDEIKLDCISDGNIGAPNSICAYIKGRKPEKFDNLVVISKSVLEGYICIINDSPKKLLNDIVDYVKTNVGFKRLYMNSTDFSKVQIGKNCIIEDDVYIGPGTVIEHGVILHSGTYIGKNCLIRSGAVIGGEGFGFIKDGNELIRETFLGQVIIGNDVEVGYNCTIMRGEIFDTIIKNGVKIDNLVHIAHDCNIGENATITAGVSLCGHVSIGENVRLAPNSTIKQRLSVGHDSVIGLGAVVTKNVPENDIMIGNPAKSLKRRVR